MAVVLLLAATVISASLSLLLFRLVDAPPVVAVITAGVLPGVFLSLVFRRFIGPLESALKGVRAITVRYAQGDFDLSPRFSLNLEFPDIADAFEQMAEGLREKIEVLTRQRNEQKAIFLGMVEAVIVLDPSLEIIEVNPAAARLMDVSTDAAKGRSLIDLIRNPDLYTFARETLVTGETHAANILLSVPEPRYLQIYATFIRRDAAPPGQSIGDGTERLVLVLHDITSLKNLERIRKDFVANVSHELKTPITSIKGFIETLKEGAVSDPETSARFLGIIEKQTERMEAIIEDLLSLSRLEQSEGRPLATTQFSLRAILDSAAELVLDRAVKKDIEVRVDCEGDLSLQGNPSLVEQAVMNLLDNAVKYSPSGGRVSVEASLEAGFVHLVVRDGGIGIPTKELPRIFERFYRVDRARSRELGSTGLGLAIVKHIALAHGGEVLVESTPGRGSAFTLKLPAQGTRRQAARESKWSEDPGGG